MSPEAYNAVFGGLGVLLTVALFWMTRKAAKEQAAKQELEQVQTEAEEHANENFTQVMDKLNAMDRDYSQKFEKTGQCLDRIREDLSEVKIKVRVHEDRWERPHLSAVPGER